ncbi:hypothetical protein EJ04DRAFT_582497 [Polyplosphaeria fusca]|uniref:Uncharacterized protein n=1 Tax=Polyplosphaeria fusca TaxID=682080 RepID=A0A9P4QKY0_9PLEO|nr:hypothetical protein EJ04DRAFT_582497 [Polyplosphaeria fusca]
MLFTTLTPTLLALASLSSAAPQSGLPATEPVLAKYDTTTCVFGGGGPIRYYELDTCYDFYESDHGLQLLALPLHCTLRTYANKGCTGETSKYGTDASGEKKCVSLQGRWSMQTTCD